MNITAFMQNAWFPEKTHQWIRDKYSQDQKFHQKILCQSASGRRLLKLMGEDMFHHIYWDNTTPATGDKSSDRLPPDIPWIHSVIEKTEADILLCIGFQARDAVPIALPRDWSGKIFFMSHPNRRGVTDEELLASIQEIKDYVVEEELRSDSSSRIG